MNIYSKFFITIIFSSITALQLAAQVQKDTTQFHDALSSMQSAYPLQNTSLAIRYTIAGEKAPGIILEAIKGNLQVAGNNYRYSIGEVDVISNGRYNIMLYKNTKLMYVTRATAQPALDPLKQISALFPMEALRQWSVSEKGKMIKLRADFDTTAALKEIEIVKDKRSGYIISMRYVIKADAAGGMGDLTTENKETYGDYVVMNTYFEQYKVFQPDNQLFDEQQYFMREGNEWRAAPAYSDYQIFKASPNL